MWCTAVTEDDGAAAFTGVTPGAHTVLASIADERGVRYKMQPTQQQVRSPSFPRAGQTQRAREKK